ncbi:Ros/MucR family transcriptional regulator [Methylobacterium sp. CM6257]|jgi:predicted transcriptional regulator
MAAADRPRLFDNVELTTTITAAYVSRNHVSPAQLPHLIASVHSKLCELYRDPVGAAVRDCGAELPSAAQIRRSVTDEALTSFIDGNSYKTLKRHLAAHGLTPEQYRSQYGLPADYPMVAPGYAARRSALAKAIGLGVPGGMARRQAAG